MNNYVILKFGTLKGYNFTDEFYQTSGLNIEYVIALPKSNNTVIKSINSLIGKTVYVQENSRKF